MNLLTASAFLKALGWSLLDSLWQMGLLYMLYLLLTANGKRYRARQRHTIALLSLAGGSAWFVASLIMHFYDALNSASAASGFSLFHISGLNRLARLAEPALPYFSSLYLAVAVLLFVRFYYQYRHTQRLFTTGLHKARPALRLFLQHMTARMSIGKEVKIWFSELVDTPLTLGFLKPVILLPIAAMNHLSLQQTEAILLHELNHIKQNDYLINLLIACADIIFFFNPFSRLFTDAVKKERENSCDDMVLQFRYDGRSYAAALLTLERNRRSSMALTVAATGKNRHLLLNRVQRILQQPAAGSLSYRLIAYLLVGVITAWIAFVNPGEAIVETIGAVKNILPAGSPEAPALYTGETGNAQDATAPAKTVALRKTAKLQLHTLPAGTSTPALWTTKQDRDEEDNVDDEANANTMTSFASATEPRDFTLALNETINTVKAVSNAFPYVPSASFMYLAVEDTSAPKASLPSVADLKARESMQKALTALKAINWQKLQKALSTNQQLDLARLQQELKKALADVDWNRVNEQVELTEQREGQRLCEQQALREQMKHYQEARKATQEKMQRLRQMIVEQHLSEMQLQQDADSYKKQGDGQKSKKKKIITI